jgi:ArsR family transcriptional regulator, arsenate/arsenite/antimonite-responsive transcriptional repressor
MTPAPRDTTAPAGAACCPLPPGVSPLPATAAELDAEAAERLAAAARALSDPIRLRMLALMAAAGSCCRGGSAAGEPDGVCVCEFQGQYGLAQSKVSYHLKVLRDAGLVAEHRRGKWSFYALDRGQAAAVLRELGAHLGL